MFCLQGIGENNSDDQSERENDFGWWLSDRRENFQSLPGKREEGGDSTGSSVTMESCADSDDPDSYVLAEDFAKRGNNRVEPRSSTPAGVLDVDLIEKDVQETKQRTFTLAITRTDCNGCTTSKAEINETRRLEGACYTPERLVKSQEYRILAPQPRYLCVSITRNPENDRPLKRAAHCSRKLDYIDDDVGPNAQARVLDGRAAKVPAPDPTDDREESCLNRITPEGKNTSFLARIKGWRKSALSRFDKSNCARRENGLIESTKVRKRSIRSKSLLLEGTSTLRWNNWRSVAHRDARTDSNHLCLCDELAMASRSFRNCEPEPRETLQKEPAPLDLTSEEDRFCRVSSTHDSLTRLALAIETDGSVSDVNNDAENIVRQLRDKLDGLRVDNEDIHRDVTSLRKDFQRDEERLTNLLSETTKLRQGVDEVRYLDDLLKLLEGEVDRISQRNWPFMLGRGQFHPEEMNLVV